MQGHWGQRSRYPLVRAGFVLVAGGVGGLGLLAVPGWPASAAVVDWVVAGAGMGLALGTISVLMLELSAESEQGANSAALQITDVVGSLACIAAGGVVLAAAGVGAPGAAATAGAVDVDPGTVGTTVALVDLGLAALAALGAVAAGRVRGRGTAG